MNHDPRDPGERTRRQPHPVTDPRHDPIARHPRPRGASCTARTGWLKRPQRMVQNNLD